MIDKYILHSYFTNMINESHKDLFIVLGYLAAHIRRTKLDIETHPDKREWVENQYMNYAQEPLIMDNVNFYVWEPSVNKWGSELRIYFNSNGNMPGDLRDMIVSPRFVDDNYNARINNNEFVWLLIKYGFRASNLQDVNRIRNRIPQDNTDEFNRGFNL